MRATLSLICLFHVSSEWCSLNHVENLSSLLQVFKDSRWSHTHASTNPCAVAHKRHTSKLILTSVAVCSFHIPMLQDGRWTALDFNMLETLVLLSVNTHKSHFQLPAPWSSMLCYRYAAKSICLLQNHIVVSYDSSYRFRFDVVPFDIMNLSNTTIKIFLWLFVMLDVLMFHLFYYCLLASAA